jgi:hypothetical protein
VTDEDREGVLGRWSRLKRTRTAEVENRHRGAAAPAVPGPSDDEKVGKPVATAAFDSSRASEQPVQPEDLPDISTLGKESDYTVFLRAGVPEDLRRQALRALWRSDPLLANLDGLNDFDEDYRTADGVVEIVRTAYRVGKGYLDKEDEAAGTEEAAMPAATEPCEPVVASEADGTSEEAVPEQAPEKADATASSSALVGRPDRNESDT